MDRRALLEVWSPRHARWSPWVKPVLFAAMDDLMVEKGTALGVPPPEVGPDDLAGIERADGSTAIFVDLPGAWAVAVGLALAGRGYRPVPLFNACQNREPPPVVPVGPIMDALIRAGPALRALDLPDDAPPAFLLDSARLGDRYLPFPAPGGWFDNRSVVFTTDVPSGRRLLDEGVRRAAVVRDREIGIDLAEMLGAWSRAGLELVDAPIGHRGALGPLALPSAATRAFATARRLLWAWLRLKPNPFGGFGRPRLPEGGSSFG